MCPLINPICFSPLTVLDVMGAEKPYFSDPQMTSVSKVYELAGSKFTYRRAGNKEAISALGPIKNRIVVKVSRISADQSGV